MILHDVLPPIQSDVNPFFYLGAFASFGVLAYLLFRFYKREKRGTTHDLQILEQCDLDDAKKTALQFSYYAKRLCKHAEEKAHLATLQEQLNAYKYIENTRVLPAHIQKDIAHFLQKIKEQHA